MELSDSSLVLAGILVLSLVTVETGGALLVAIVLCAPLGFLAIEAGWAVTEVGRQPWIIHHVLRTADAVTPMRGLIAPFSAFAALYIILALIVAAIMSRIIRAADQDQSLPVDH